MFTARCHHGDVVRDVPVAATATLSALSRDVGIAFRGEPGVMRDLRTGQPLDNDAKLAAALTKAQSDGAGMLELAIVAESFTPWPVSIDSRATLEPLDRARMGATSPSGPGSSRGVAGRRRRHRRRRNDSGAAAEASTPGSRRSGTGKRLVKFEYQVGQVIAHGAYGVVHLCLRADTGEMFALKELRAIPGDHVDVHERLAAMDSFNEEARMLRKRKHRNVVRYIGTQKGPGCYRIFMEYVPGGNVRSFLQRFGVLSEEVVRAYTRQLLNGLVHVHRLGIAHGALSLAHLLVQASGVVKLTGFGDAVWVGMGRRSHATAARDIWDVGRMVMEMVTGRLLAIECPDDNPTFVPTLEPPDLPGSLSPELREFVGRCLQPDTTLRATAAELSASRFLQRRQQPVQELTAHTPLVVSRRPAIGPPSLCAYRCNVGKASDKPSAVVYKRQVTDVFENNRMAGEWWSALGRHPSLMGASDGGAAAGAVAPAEDWNADDDPLVALVDEDGAVLRPARVSETLGGEAVGGDGDNGATTARRFTTASTAVSSAIGREASNAGAAGSTAGQAAPEATATGSESTVVSPRGQASDDSDSPTRSRSALGKVAQMFGLSILREGKGSHRSLLSRFSKKRDPAHFLKRVDGDGRRSPVAEVPASAPVGQPHSMLSPAAQFGSVSTAAAVGQHTAHADAWTGEAEGRVSPSAQRGAAGGAGNASPAAGALSPTGAATSPYPRAGRGVTLLDSVTEDGSDDHVGKLLPTGLGSSGVGSSGTRKTQTQSSLGNVRVISNSEDSFASAKVPLHTDSGGMHAGRPGLHAAMSHGVSRGYSRGASGAELGRGYTRAFTRTESEPGGQLVIGDGGGWEMNDPRNRPVFDGGGGGPGGGTGQLSSAQATFLDRYRTKDLDAPGYDAASGGSSSPRPGTAPAGLGAAAPAPGSKEWALAQRQSSGLHRAFSRGASREYGRGLSRAFTRSESSTSDDALNLGAGGGWELNDPRNKPVFDAGGGGSMATHTERSSKQTAFLDRYRTRDLDEEAAIGYEADPLALQPDDVADARLPKAVTDEERRRQAVGVFFERHASLAGDSPKADAQRLKDASSDDVMSHTHTSGVSRRSDPDDEFRSVTRSSFAERSEGGDEAEEEDIFGEESSSDEEDGAGDARPDGAAEGAGAAGGGVDAAQRKEGGAGARSGGGSTLVARSSEEGVTEEDRRSAAALMPRVDSVADDDDWAVYDSLEPLPMYGAPDGEPGSVSGTTDSGLRSTRATVSTASTAASMRGVHLAGDAPQRVVQRFPSSHSSMFATSSAASTPGGSIGMLGTPPPVMSRPTGAAAAAVRGRAAVRIQSACRGFLARRRVRAMRKAAAAAAEKGAASSWIRTSAGRQRPPDAANGRGDAPVSGTPTSGARVGGDTNGVARALDAPVEVDTSAAAVGDAAARGSPAPSGRASVGTAGRASVASGAAEITMPESDFISADGSDGSDGRRPRVHSSAWRSPAHYDRGPLGEPTPTAAYAALDSVIAKPGVASPGKPVIAGGSGAQ